jgi:hypothetical protein
MPSSITVAPPMIPNTGDGAGHRLGHGNDERTLASSSCSGDFEIGSSQHWASDRLPLLNAYTDPKLNAAELEAVRKAEYQFADEQASKAKTGLKDAIAKARSISGSARLASVINIRDKHLAHALETTRREKRGQVSPMKYGDETALLDQSASIVEQLFAG